jgi:glyoxylase-like metal-dependent hydrolase (beta-lactamase superfamily II)
MREVLPGVFHWTAFHDGIGIDVHSYLFAPAGVLLDPMTPSSGLRTLPGDGAPHAILLTNRHHYRHSDRFVEAFGCAVLAPRAGMHEFSSEASVEPYDPGDQLPGGIVAHAVGAICPDEYALYHPTLRVLACADGLFRGDNGAEPLGFVPDEYMGEDPAAVKAGLIASYRRLADELAFDHLLLAHGQPIIGQGRGALRAFVAQHT